MFLHRSRGRGGRSFSHWLLNVQSVRKLLIVLSAIAFTAVNVHHFNSATRRYKDCSVPWRTAAAGPGLDATDDGSGAGGSGSRGNGGLSGGADGGPRMRIALVSMSTGRARDPAAARQQASVNARSVEFSGLLDLTGPNKRLFAELHGYSYVDASELLDNSRPASWSKIPAVLSVLDEYDWIFWLDADTLITNLTTPLETLLPPLELAASGTAPDLLLTADSTGVNAGVWLIRGAGCGWCRAFLERWWGMEGFIRRTPGDTKSGDNDALKHMVAAMDSAELRAHVGLAPQCAFNSYLWRGSLRNVVRYIINPRRVLTGLWRPGDFVMHAAGVHNKMAVLKRFLDGIQQQPGRQPLHSTGGVDGPHAFATGVVSDSADPRVVGAAAPRRADGGGGGSGESRPLGGGSASDRGVAIGEQGGYGEGTGAGTGAGAGDFDGSGGSGGGGGAGGRELLRDSLQRGGADGGRQGQERRLGQRGGGRRGGSGGDEAAAEPSGGTLLPRRLARTTDTGDTGAG